MQGAGLLALAASLPAFAAALASRRALVSQLGRGWLVRFLVVQLGVINVVLLGIVLLLAQGWGLPSWGFALVYAGLFFAYTRSNIAWTAKKFHLAEEAGS